MTTLDLQQMASATAGVLHDTDPELLQSVFRLLRLLLDGAPVSAGGFAASAGISHAEADAVFGRLRAWGAEFDEEGAFVGAGLTLAPTPHRYEVNGHHYFTWCAPDAILFPLMFGHTAVIDSPDPVSGERVQVTISPTGIETFEPATAVLSSRCGGDAANVRGSICQFGRLFASRESASAYVGLREGVALAIITPDEAFRLAQVLSEEEPLRSIKEAV